jgi:hypothetical protein
MPIQINQENHDGICVVRVSGELVSADYQHLISEFERLATRHGKTLRVLFDMSDFHGWDAGALWQELKFDLKYFGDIERLAAVGDQHWQHWLMEFCRPFTKATIHYFDCANTAAARKWLDEPSALAETRKLYAHT